MDYNYHHMKIPFHRRIMPWVFALIFLFMAPAVVFYTAGYRWNQNKGVIERNGTIMFDTLPRGADIFLNGQKLDQKTPFTMQNVAPGTYEIKYVLKGFHEWAKTLPVDPERVTFATEVNLWPDAQPELAMPGDFPSLIADPQGSYVLLAGAPKNRSTDYMLVDSATAQTKNRVTANSEFVPQYADWDKAGDVALLYGTASSVSQTCYLQTKALTPNRMPDGIYHWDGSDLVGFADRQKITVQNDGAVEHTPQPSGIHDVLAGFSLRYVTGTADLVLTLNKKTDQGFVLPPGQWQFRAQPDSTLLLQSGKDWMWIDLATDPLTVNRLQADWLWPMVVKRQTRYLALNGNEVYVWDSGHEPELIYRQSDKLVSAAWYADGKDVMVATKNAVIMFNLDARNGRYKTTLATFDEIAAATVANENVFVSATKNGQTGFWRLPLAISNAILPSLPSFGGF